MSTEDGGPRADPEAATDTLGPVVRALVVATLAGGLLAGVGTGVGPGVAQAGDATGPRVLLLYDMEGVTAVAGPADVRFGAPGYDAARAALTAEVNAAVRGLLRGGAADVVLADVHGSGNPDPDYDVSRLPTGARHTARSAPFDPFLEGPDSTVAAVVAIGMHGRADGGGFLAHTFYGHTRWALAGVPMNESMLAAASAARFGVPLILVTGDDVLERELADTLPATAFVRTKRAAGPRSAEPRPEAEVRREIEEAAEAAFHSRSEIPAWRPPLDRRPVSELGYTLPDHAALAIHYPGARPVNDRTIALDAPTFERAYLDFRALAHFTLVAPLRQLQAALPRVEGGREVLMRVRQEMSIRPSFESRDDAIPDTFSALGTHGYR